MDRIRSPWPRRPGPPADERVTPSIPRRATRWVLTLLAVVPACAPADGRRASTVTVDTLAGGVVRVRNAGPGLWSDAETWRIVEDLRISSDDPADPATFSQVTALGAEDIPDEKPAFDRIHFDDAGHVIVEPDGPPADAGRVFDVFDRDGRFLGQARGDVAFETFPALPVFAGGFVYGVATEASGIQVVVRARIVVGRP